MISEKKAQARKFFRQKREEIVQTDPGRVLALRRAVSAWLSGIESAAVGFYAASHGEPDLMPELLAWADGGPERYLALPVVDDRENRLMTYRRWDGKSALVPGAYGIPEPVTGAFVIPDMILCPCVAFDARGRRLGNGGGYFDRFLARTGRERPLTVGIAFEALFWKDSCADAHDLPMDWILTEKGASRGSGRGGIR